MGEPVPTLAAVCATAGCPEPCVPEDELPGWEEDITACRNENELPKNARDYLQYISDFVKVPVALIGVGPARDEVIWTQAGAGMYGSALA